MRKASGYGSYNYVMDVSVNGENITLTKFTHDSMDYDYYTDLEYQSHNFNNWVKRRVIWMLEDEKIKEEIIEMTKNESMVIVEKINNGEYTIETRSECGCSISWGLNGEELIADVCTDCCWIGYILVVDGEDVAQHVYGESFEWLIDIDRFTDGFEDAEEKIIDEMNIGDFTFDSGTVPEHEEAVEKSLIEFLEEKESEGYNLMRDNLDGFANQYTCVLVSSDSIDEIDEDWDELTPEEWASEFLYKGDAATQAYNSFKLI